MNLLVGYRTTRNCRRSRNRVPRHLGQLIKSQMLEKWMIAEQHGQGVFAVLLVDDLLELRGTLVGVRANPASGFPVARPCRRHAVAPRGMRPSAASSPKSWPAVIVAVRMRSTAMGKSCTRIFIRTSSCQSAISAVAQTRLGVGEPPPAGWEWSRAGRWSGRLPLRFLFAAAEGGGGNVEEEDLDRAGKNQKRGVSIIALADDDVVVFITYDPRVVGRISRSGRLAGNDLGSSR